MQGKISQIPLGKDFLKYFLTEWGEKQVLRSRANEEPSKSLRRLCSVASEKVFPFSRHSERRALATIRERISLLPELARFQKITKNSFYKAC